MSRRYGGSTVFFHAVVNGTIGRFGTWNKTEGIQENARDINGCDTGAYIEVLEDTATVYFGISFVGFD